MDDEEEDGDNENDDDDDCKSLFHHNCIYCSYEQTCVLNFHFLYIAPPPIVKKRKLGKNPTVDTSFLPDRDREVRSNYQCFHLHDQNIHLDFNLVWPCCMCIVI